jgi:hypothetical protein
LGKRRVLDMKGRKSLGNLRLIAVAAIAVLTLGGASSALAVEPTTGQPGAKAGNHCGEPGLVAPGGSEAAKGSVFNPVGVSTEHYAGNPGTASLEHSAAPTIAESQYDTACLNQSLH